MDTVTTVTELQKASSALNYISPNCDRLTWVRIAAALKDGFDDEGFTLFDDWSKGGEAYEAWAARDTWKSIRAGRGITLATLYHEAMQNGFQPREWKTAVSSFKPSADEIARRSAERNQQEIRDKKRQAVVAQKAAAIYQSTLRLEPSHPYIQKKFLSNHPLFQGGNYPNMPRELSVLALTEKLGYHPEANDIPLEGRVIVIPLTNGRHITSLEFIDEHGHKTALAGGVKKGCWAIVLPWIDQHDVNLPIIVVEGWATAHSVQWALLQKSGPTAYVVAAGSDTNLKNVAVAVHMQHPGSPIVIGSDIGNQASHKMASDAASAVNGGLMEPEFSEIQNSILTSHLKKPPTDFNDSLAYHMLSNLPLEGFHNDLRDRFLKACPTSPAKLELTNESGSDKKIVRSFREESSFRKERFVEHNQGDRKMTESTPIAAETAAHQSPTASNRHEAGEYLYNVKDLPPDLSAEAKKTFGERNTLYTPRENGGPYNGEVQVHGNYLIQEVGARSVVVHDKANIEFVNDRLQWLSDNNKLNGHELMVVYQGDKAKVYPYDRTRDELSKAVGSFKKSAKELGLTPDFAKSLDQTFEKSMERIYGLRKEAIERSRPVKDSPAPPEATPEKANQAPTKSSRKR